jgi:hypothetical protein
VSPLTRTRGDITQEASKFVQLRREAAIDRPQFPSDEDRKKGSFFEADIEPDTDAEDDDRELQDRTGLKRLVCCSVKDHANGNILNQLDPGDNNDVFPATRMISDENEVLSSVCGQKADFLNGVMGVPSDQFIDTKGPQSLYAYDYESNEAMDALYSEFGKEARKSLFLRKLGPPPTLLSSSGSDEVVVKVAVRSKARFKGNSFPD